MLLISNYISFYPEMILISLNNNNRNQSRIKNTFR